MVLQTKTSVILIICCCLFTVTCSNGKKGIATVDVDAKILPWVHSEDVSSLISDSGVTRYRVEAKIWDIYSNDAGAYWHFPRGFYVEKFDSVFNVQGFVRSDTAYFYEKSKLWRLVGNVHIQNLEGWKFDTSELFWNQTEPANSLKSIYTDSVVRIDKNNGEKIVVSRGMKSNQSMTHYILYKSYMEANVNENVQSTATPSPSP